MWRCKGKHETECETSGDVYFMPQASCHPAEIPSKAVMLNCGESNSLPPRLSSWAVRGSLWDAVSCVIGWNVCLQQHCETELPWNDWTVSLSAYCEVIRVWCVAAQKAQHEERHQSGAVKKKETVHSIALTLFFISGFVGHVSTGVQLADIIHPLHPPPFSLTPSKTW